MEWLAFVVVGLIAISIAFNVLKDMLGLANRVYHWLVAPKEWWSGFLVHGTFRPRASTLLLAVLAPLALCAIAVLFFVLALGSSLDWLGLGAIGTVFVTPLATKKLWTYLRKREHVRMQRTRDKHAATLAAAISSGASPGKYCLYLRPFTSTGEVPTCVLHSTMLARLPTGKPLPPTQDRRTVDFEQLLAGALDSYSPLIGLGLPGEQVGAGRIHISDENWQPEFRRLAAGALFILMIPSTRQGTAWELNTILEDLALLSKTVFIIPPDAGNAAIYRLALGSFDDIAGTDLLRLASRGQRNLISTNGLVFRWNRTAHAVTFSAPLVHYVQPSPVRFLLDLWLSRDTEVVSGWKLKRNLLSVMHCEPRARQTDVSS